ncbi:MAG: translocation/assembly module TamB domain-containing protein, partial [Acidobacteria bacterium]|nr:translocation/assembly module TamB domain-containing protein [Acidobacteriota bacterium]
ASFSHPALPFAVSGIGGEIRLDGADLQLGEIRGSLPEGTFTVTGRLPLGSLPAGIGTGAESMDLKLALRSAGTGNVAHLLPEPARSDLHFKADADLHLTGRIGSLSDLNFEGTVSGAGLKYADWTLEAAPFPVSKQDDLLSATGITFAGDGISVNGSGDLAIGGGVRRLRASIRGDVENRVLNSRVSGSEFGGRTTLDLSIDGPPSSPALSGEVKVAGGSVRIPERRLDLTGVSGNVRFAGSRASIELVGKLNGGETTMAGDAEMDGRRMASMVLDASFENCAVFYPEGLQGKMDGRVTFTRDSEAVYDLDGDLWLRDGLYRKNVSLGRQLLSGLAKKQEKAEAPVLADMRLNVRVSPVGSVRVKNDVADLRFEGDVTVRGTRGKPVLVGQIRTLPDGKFYFQGRRYAIAKGILSFEGDDQLDPRADVRATVDVKYTSPRNPYGSQTRQDPHKISVELLGKISDPTIHLMDDSPSPLSEVEIASLLLTGQVLGGGSTSSKEDYRSQMVRILGGSVGSTFLPVIGRKLGVDQFDIQPAYIANKTDQPTARAVIGKDLGGGFFFTYSPDLSNSQRYLWIIDYQLGHNVALRASRQDDASYLGRVSHNVGFNLFAGRHEQSVITMTGTPSFPDPHKEYIAEITVDGLKATNAGLALRQLTFRAGEELDYQRLYASQRKLYSLNVFRSVRVYAEPLPGRKGLVVVRVMLAEHNVYQAFYGLRYNTQGKIAGVENKQNPAGFDGELDVHNVNLFGKGIDAGFYTRQSVPERNYRLTMTLPYVFSHKFNTNVLLYRRNLTEEEATTLVTETRGASLQLEHRLAPGISLRYFSNYKRTRVTEKGATDHEPIDVVFSRFRLGTAVIGDFRDDPLDAKKGLFASATFEYQPRWLGSDLTLLKSFSQLSLYYTIFNKITFAVNNRVGVIDNFGGDVPPSDLFYSGGSVSVRSFDEDYLGPRDPFVPEQPWGGRAVIVYNQEIRFPIRALSKRIALKGVLFHDAGNIFREVSELRAFDVRRSAGVGLRLDTPFSLFRLDYAVTIDPRPEDNRDRWIFSLGQMF